MPSRKPVREQPGGAHSTPSRAQLAWAAASMPTASVRGQLFCRPAHGRAAGGRPSRSIPRGCRSSQNTQETSSDPALLSTKACRPLSALWAQQRGSRGHALPARASLNDNQLACAPWGPGSNPWCLALARLLATNRTVNVGLPASPLPQDQQHPDLELGRRASPTVGLAEMQNSVCPGDSRPCGAPS